MCRDILIVLYFWRGKNVVLGCVSHETLDRRATNRRPNPADDLEGTPQRDPIGSCSTANRQSPV